MWLKSASVWVVLNLGYNVFFSDVDVMWFTDVLPIVESNVFTGVGDGFDKTKDKYPGGAKPIFDTVWMDTGPRPARQGPFFMNSGFFLLRYTRATVRLWDDVTMLHYPVLTYRSQQQPINSLLGMYCGRGLKVGRLCHQIVAGGMVSSGSKKIKKMEELRDARRTPAAFHMHWTGDKPRKIVKAKMFQLWFLQDDGTASGRATTKGARAEEAKIKGKKM